MKEEKNEDLLHHIHDMLHQDLEHTSNYKQYKDNKGIIINSLYYENKGRYDIAKAIYNLLEKELFGCDYIKKEDCVIKLWSRL
mgnify:FL=1